MKRPVKKGFTLLEVMIATIILSAGLVVLLTSFMQCQKVMTASQSFETAHYVLTLGETAYPLPAPEQVTDDPIDNEQLNIEETEASKLLDELEMDELPRERQQALETYTFERTVDEVDDDELRRSGWLYTVRTIIRWGAARLGKDRDEMTVITLWRKAK